MNCSTFRSRVTVMNAQLPCPRRRQPAHGGQPAITAYGHGRTAVLIR
jgi:hypothetical protein